MMLSRGMFVHVVAGETGDCVVSADDDVADVFVDVPVRRVLHGEVFVSEVGLEVAKEIVAGHEVIWIGEPDAA